MVGPEGGLGRALVLFAALAMTAGGTIAVLTTHSSAAPSCNGKAATIDDHDGEIAGTEDRDVIVGDGGPNRISGRGGNDLICGRGGDDDISGGGNADDLRGGPGDDQISGGAGSDEHWGGAGSDTMSGGGGINTVHFGDSPAGVVVDLKTGSASGNGQDTLTDFGHVYGSAHDDYLSGTDDLDSLIGGDGNDTFVGLLGNDGLHGGGGTDTVTYLKSDRGVVVNLTATRQSGNPGNNDFLSSIENVEGSTHDDEITGNAVLNSIRAARGNDVIRGFGAADDLLGNRGSDRIFGNDGDDALGGGPGRDHLDGGPGRDTLAGGAGSDRCLRDPDDSKTSCERN